MLAYVLVKDFVNSIPCRIFTDHNAAWGSKKRKAAGPGISAVLLRFFFDVLVDSVLSELS